MILISMAVLGISLLLLSLSYFKEEKYAYLEKISESAAYFTLNNYYSSDGAYINKNIVTTGVEVLSSVNDAVIFLTDINGKTVICSIENSNHFTYLVPKDVLDEVLRFGIYKGRGTLGDIYGSSYYTVGVPILLKDGKLLGIAFASADAQAVTTYISRIVKMFGISSLAVIIISFIVIYLVTMRFVKPLRQMSFAAKEFGRGNFTIRVPVESYDEIGHLAMSFNNMATSLATFEGTRRSFVANVSHELKTPMTTIGGFIDGILDGTIPPEKQEYYLKIVSEEVKRLSRLVVSMLNISRMEAGEEKVKPSVFNINDVACRSLLSLEQKIEAKNIDIRGFDVDKILVNADVDMIYQVVYNLLDNAVKFTNQNGYIEISYSNDGNMVTTRLKNTGQGIPKDDIQNIFDRFYKIDKSRSLDKQGMGLGLYIVKSIINMHGGEIIAESVEGEYCEFIFTLPKGDEKELKHKKLKG
ncbi:MAG: HAMP domain-containing histidine kinase [Oscillospiraceae bacterium]|nr:HAMP domain-containing histidine kinase [Oscillospiraceae bacterium]